LLRIKPAVIISFGGYLAAPVVLSGWLLGIPSITHEQTIVTGYANKFIALFAKKVLISWESSAEYFPKKKVVYSGLPLRESIFEQRSTSFVSQNSLPTIYITAGKTGSHILNRVVRESLAELLSFCNVIHQCGDNSNFKDYQDLQTLYAEIDPLCIGEFYLRKFVFETEVGEALNTASVVISRSGAHICGELFVLEKPSLLIPIPWVSHNEQQRNAELLEKAGLSKILKEADLNQVNFVNAIKDIVFHLDDYLLKDIGLKNVIVKNAPDIILNEALKVAKKNMIDVPIMNGTIPHQIEVKLGSAHIMLRPAKEGTSIVAGGTIRTICNLAGVKDIVAKILGTANKINNSKATILAFERLSEDSNYQKGKNVKQTK